MESQKVDFRSFVPTPGSESAQMCPSDYLTIPYTVARPRPVPTPFGLVVKNGSKIFSRAAASMPQPVSVSRSATYLPGRIVPRAAACASSNSTAAISIVSLPSRGCDKEKLQERLAIDMIETGIIDPTKVTRPALQNAALIAGLMVTTECVIADKPEEDKKMGGLPGGPAAASCRTRPTPGLWSGSESARGLQAPC